MAIHKVVLEDGDDLVVTAKLQRSAWDPAGAYNSISNVFRTVAYAPDSNLRLIPLAGKAILNKCWCMENPCYCQKTLADLAKELPSSPARREIEAVGCGKCKKKWSKKKTQRILAKRRK